MKTFLALLLIAVASPALATVEGWPALFDVRDVAETDVLNVRAEPDARSEVLGSFAHDARNIEVIRANETGTWGLVNMSDLHGWVSLRFLSRQPGQHDALYPEITQCGGTEPFWSLRRKEGMASLDIFLTDRPTLTEPIHWEIGTVNHRHRYAFRTDQMIGVLSRQYCDDGMSDREYGLELNLILPEEPLHLQGCCSIQPREE